MTEGKSLEIHNRDKPRVALTRALSDAIAEIKNKISRPRAPNQCLRNFILKIRAVTCFWNGILWII